MIRAPPRRGPGLGYGATMPAPFDPAPVDASGAAAAGDPATDHGRGRAIGGLVVAAMVAAFLTLSVVTDASWVDTFDTSLTTSIRGWADAAGWPVDLARRVGGITEPVWSMLVAAGLVLALARARFRAAAAFLALSTVLGVTLTTLVKDLVGRPRPDLAEGNVVSMDVSFPSGHASAGIYLYLATGVVLLLLGRANAWPWVARIGIALIVAGPLLGLSRLVFGVHWPSDVLAGWAYGSVALLTSALLVWDPLRRGWIRPEARDDLSPTPNGTEERP